jgi:hypothetical protein
MTESVEKIPTPDEVLTEMKDIEEFRKLNLPRPEEISMEEYEKIWGFLKACQMTGYLPDDYLRIFRVGILSAMGVKQGILCSPGRVF